MGQPEFHSNRSQKLAGRILSANMFYFVNCINFVIGHQYINSGYCP